MVDLYSLKACPYRSSVGAKGCPIRVPAIPLLLLGGHQMRIGRDSMGIERVTSEISKRSRRG